MKKLFYVTLFSVLLMGFLSCRNPLASDNPESEQSRSAGSQAAASEMIGYNSVVTCYWRMDPQNENEMKDFQECRCTQIMYTGVIDWSTNTLKSYSPLKDGSDDVVMNGALLERYTMEGCGIYYAKNESDFIVQLQGKYLIDNPDGSMGKTVIAIFEKLKVSDFPWGQGYYEKTVALKPWKTAAVSAKIKRGSNNVYVPFMVGKKFINPDTGLEFSHDGYYDGQDTSWSFKQSDLDLSQNSKVDVWIDLFTATFDGYLDTKTVVDEVLDDPDDDSIWMQDLWQKDASGQVVKDEDGPQWATKIKVEEISTSYGENDSSLYFMYGLKYKPGNLAVYNNYVYKNTFSDTALPGREPDNPVMWAIWSPVGPFVPNEHCPLE